jgi:hypothetical protein
MAESGIRSAGDPLEKALRAYETVLSESTWGRHAQPENTSRLEEGRMAVIRQAEALPKACWPREMCERCRGQREVEVVQPGYRAPNASVPEVRTVKRMCRWCWGTGLTVNVSQGRRGSENADGA